LPTANQGTPNTTQSLASCRNTGVMLRPSVVQSKQQNLQSEEMFFKLQVLMADNHSDF
jgi:hypothetical protein